MSGHLPAAHPVAIRTSTLERGSATAHLRADGRKAPAHAAASRGICWLDDNFDAGYSAFEESIVIITATAFDEAYILAEKHGKSIKTEDTNIYRQTVKVKFIRSIDCHWFPDSPTKSTS